MLEDIAILTGGKVIAEEMGAKLENTRIKTSAAAARFPSIRTTPPLSTAPATGRTSKAVSR